MFRSTRGAAVAGLLCVGLVIGVSQAWAGSAHYCTGNLNHGWSCADGSVHTGAVYVEVITDHTGCAAMASGYGGYNSSPTGDNTFLVACTSGAGTSGGTVSGGGHGAVFNPNAATNDYIYDAHISW